VTHAACLQLREAVGILIFPNCMDETGLLASLASELNRLFGVQRSHVVVMPVEMLIGIVKCKDN